MNKTSAPPKCHCAEHTATQPTCAKDKLRTRIKTAHNIEAQNIAIQSISCMHAKHSEQHRAKHSNLSIKSHLCPQNSVLFKRKTAFCVGKSFNFTGTKLLLLFGGCCLLFGPNCSTSPHQMLSILPWMQVPSKPIFGLHHSHIWRMKTKSCGANLY